MERVNPEGEIVIGSRVHLRTCPHGEPGIVDSISKGRAQVTWRDLGITTSHRFERLQPAPFPKHLVLDQQNPGASPAQHQAFASASATGILERERGEARQCVLTGF
ncbi:MAG: hypothetical protein WB622_22035 [Acidobacteriaceae bacterium]